MVAVDKIMGETCKVWERRMPLRIRNTRARWGGNERNKEKTQ